MSKLNIILAVVVVVVAILLSTLGAPIVQGLQVGFDALISPFIRTSSAVGEQIGSVGQNLKTLDELEGDNRRLQVENRELRATNQLLRDLEAENNRLRLALDYRERSVFRLLPAQVISRSSSSWWNTVMINRGFEDGIESDMPVLTETGLVGKTTTVGKDQTKVLLITDETCQVAGRVEGTLEQGIITGIRPSDPAEDGLLQMGFLSKKADLQPDLKVYTAGVTGGVFPAGVLIGTVKSFRVRPLDGQAILSPAVDLSSLKDVFVVVVEE